MKTLVNDRKAPVAAVASSTNKEHYHMGEAGDSNDNSSVTQVKLETVIIATAGESYI